MSSVSPTNSSRPEIFIVGNSLTAPVLALSFRAFGHAVETVVLPSGHQPPQEVAVYVGNGEWHETARRIFGAPLAQSLWEISTRNFARARALLRELGIDTRERGTSWAFDSKGELKSRLAGARGGPGFSFAPGDLIDHISVTSAQRLVSLRRAGPLEIELGWAGDRGESRRRASIVVYAHDLLEPALFPSLHDKWIPVTLSSFEIPARALPFSLALFHGGADFAVSGERALRLGSFRNLYQDKAVGVHDRVDPATAKGVRSLFGEMGLIPEGVSPRSCLCLESLSCDGLPLVGSMAELPGVYVVGGFAGRTANFIFAVAEMLASAIFGEGSFDPLSIFSTRRFL